MTRLKPWLNLDEGIADVRYIWLKMLHAQLAIALNGAGFAASGTVEKAIDDIEDWEKPDYIDAVKWEIQLILDDIDGGRIYTRR